MEEHLHRAPRAPALGDRALELERIDLEVFASRARVILGIDAVVLVGQVLELDRPICEQAIGFGPFQKAAAFARA